MRQIFKYKLVTGEGSTILVLPESAEILSAGVQENDIVVWASLSLDDNATSQFEFIVVPTGSSFDNEKDYGFVQTVFMGWMVFHIFVRELG